MTRHRPPKPRPGGLGDDLERLAQADPQVREASDRVDWVAQKAAMGWPQPVQIRKSPPPADQRFEVTAPNNPDGTPPFVVEGVPTNTVIADGADELRYWLREAEEGDINVIWRRIDQS